jgi:hypothetical protein
MRSSIVLGKPVYRFNLPEKDTIVSLSFAKGGAGGECLGARSNKGLFVILEERKGFPVDAANPAAVEKAFADRKDMLAKCDEARFTLRSAFYRTRFVASYDAAGNVTKVSEASTLAD